MLNLIWVAMLLVAVVCGAITGKLGDVAKASTDAAGSAVTLAIGLVGVMALWIGLMRVLQEGGYLQSVARGLRPVMHRLFPDVPPEHPAMSMMILNITANMLGLANAATPFGIKAMMELDKLNRQPGTATNAMALFLAINTTNVAILPTGVIALRASLGAVAPASIFLTTLIATSISTIVGILTAKTLVRLPRYALTPAEASAPAETAATGGPEVVAELPPSSGMPVSGGHRRVLWFVVWAIAASLGYALWRSAALQGWPGALRTSVETWPLAILMVLIVFLGLFRQVRIYDAVVEGGKEGFQVALKIIPYLVAILVAVGMLRASGAIDLIVLGLSPLTNLIGMPAETLPMALLRPLSGSGAYAVAAEIMKANGPDSLIGQIVSTMQGSSETTFYVLAVYFGAAQVRSGRHTLPACLIGDTAGMLAAVWTCRLLLQ